MSSVPHERLVDLFQRLVLLSTVEREASLRDCDPDTRAQLERLLAADAVAADPLASAVAAGAEALVIPFVSGARLGAYRVLREVGAGGMGSVLLAERADGQFKQQVAIKLIRGFPTEEGMRRLRLERQILAQLDHPNIAHLLDGGESTDGQPFVVMEFVAGLPLLEHVAKHNPDLRGRLALFDKIAAAVQHAHERLVIHRDLKPGNVMVREDGEPKLLDFGVAKLVDLSAASDPRQTSTRVWTPGYASPEQQSGGLVTTASDVFGLAILLREMLSGERESGRTSSMPEGFRALTLDAELRGILAKAGAEASTQRYPTVEALRADVQRWREGRPVHAAPDTAGYRLRKFLGRHRVGTALGLLALIGVTAFVWRLALERERALVAEVATARALVAAEREGANARAALGFLSDAISAAVPENALSTEVSVRELLDHARTVLDKRAAQEPQVKQPIQRLLGHLYFSLGEPTIAAELFAAGLQGVESEQRAEALALAADHDGHASVLGALEQGKESLAAAQRGADLRQRFAPDDIEQRLRSLDQLAFGHYRLNDYAQADRLWSEVLALSADLPNPPADVLSNTYQAFGGMLDFNGETARALALVDAGLAFAQKHLPVESPNRVNLLRLKAEVSMHSGDAAQAERVVREAIALQERTVGTRGVRTATLYNTLGIVLNELGRYRESIEALTHATDTERASRRAPTEDAIGLANLASTMESAGDYPGALALFEQALATIEKNSADPDELSRRMLERNYARCLALSGRYPQAGERLAHLRQRARDLDGEDSFEYAMTTWQSVVLARRQAQPVRGLALLEEALTRFDALMPETHPVFAHARRARADFARMQRDFELAEREQRGALAQLEAAGVLPVDVAIARAELAAILLARGVKPEARTLLDQALPVLRDALLPQEVSRAAAEELLKSL